MSTIELSNESGLGIVDSNEYVNRGTSSFYERFNLDALDSMYQRYETLLGNVLISHHSAERATAVSEKIKARLKIINSAIFKVTNTTS